MSKEQINKWSLGHVYDLTEYFNSLVDNKKILGVDDCYKHGYFVSHDVWDTHIYRIQVGINAEYDEEPRTKIIETKKISHDELRDYYFDNYNLNLSLFDEREIVDLLVEQIGIEKVLKAIIEIDYDNGFENDDVNEYRYDTPLEQLIRDIDGGYGITKFKLEEIMDGQRLITLTDGTGMGGITIVFKTNAPIEELKELEKISNEVYLNNGDEDDIPDWSTVLEEKGYTFEFVDECMNVEIGGTADEWLVEDYPMIQEHYVIDDQPELLNKY